MEKYERMNDWIRVYLTKTVNSFQRCYFSTFLAFFSSLPFGIKHTRNKTLQNTAQMQFTLDMVQYLNSFDLINIPALINPFAMAWAILPPPIKPILCMFSEIF